MAGKPGRSGGPRENAGGYREGSGPKSKPPDVAEQADPLAFLLDVMQGKIDPSPSQLKAAIAATQYVHAKVGDGGKKDVKADKAKQAAKGKFAAASPPLRVVGGA